MITWVIQSGTYGAVAGAVTALTLWAMKWLEHYIWSGQAGPWQTGAVIMAGGGLIAWMRCHTPQAGIGELLDAAHHSMQVQRRWVLMLALTAVVSVAFGGAIGPEAGLIAVGLALSRLVNMVMRLDFAQQRAVTEVTMTASLAAWYGSPPAGAEQVRGEHPVPRPLLWWAGLMGMLGFGFTAKHLLGGGLHRLELPAHAPSGDGSDLLWACLPALFGLAVGMGFAKLLPFCRAVLARSGGAVAQTLIGSLLFALLATLWPVLRFSGHHDLARLPEWLQIWGGMGLLVLAALKVLALSICLASGWLGGSIFPLLMAGGSAGLASVVLLPDMPAAVAMASGMGAAATVGLGKPLIVVLILVFLAGPNTLPAACVGAFVGYLALQRWPSPAQH